MAEALEAKAIPLRIVQIATFLPAFPLCIAHGALSQSPIPAVGLIPLAISSSLGVFLVTRYREHSHERQQNPHTNNVEAQQEEGRRDVATPTHDEEDDAEEGNSTDQRPILIFTMDLILAAALMVVLVCTWIRTANGKDSGQLAMLSAYATLPLMINFLVHLYVAVRSLSAGLALPDLMRWLAWQVVPPDCPDCGHRLRPETVPKMPWLESMSVSFPRSTIKNPSEWKVPIWLKPGPQLKLQRQNEEEGYAPLFVDGGRDRGEEEEEPYRDDPDLVGESSMRVEEPVEVEIATKNGTPKSGKGKNPRMGSPGGEPDL